MSLIGTYNFNTSSFEDHSLIIYYVLSSQYRSQCMMLTCSISDIIIETNIFFIISRWKTYAMFKTANYNKDEYHVLQYLYRLNM